MYIIESHVYIIESPIFFWVIYDLYIKVLGRSLEVGGRGKRISTMKAEAPLFDRIQIQDL